MHWRKSIIPGCLLAALTSAAAHANTGITIEAVDQYSCGALANNKANVDNFRNRMLSIAGFTAGVRFTDGSVFSTDFIDPEAFGSGADSFNFDRSGDAISYFSGHGTCDDQTSTFCTSAASCPDQPGLQKACMNFGFGLGTCSYSRPRNIVVDRTGTSCELVDYSTNKVRFGEDAASGAWAGAGTNGGINFAIIDNSCGISPGLFVGETIASYAGISTIGFIMPTRFGDDTADVADRGRSWADRFVANPGGAAAPAWADALNSTTGGSGCAFGGGGHGIVGCGANIAISMDTTQARAQFSTLTEDWAGFRNEANDAAGWGWWWGVWTCNYDCNANPFTLP
jgi:hypothetical protein